MQARGGVGGGGGEGAGGCGHALAAFKYSLNTQNCVEPPALAKNFKDACPKPENSCLASVAAVQPKLAALGGKAVCMVCGFKVEGLACSVCRVSG